MGLVWKLNAVKMPSAAPVSQHLLICGCFPQMLPSRCLVAPEKERGQGQQ